MPQHIRKGDSVMVLAGDDCGSIGRVLRVLPKRRKVLVEGMNIHKKHVRPSQANRQGGIIDKEALIDLSNVAPVVEGKATRVRFQSRPDGAKVRLAVRGGQTLGPELRKAAR